MQAIRYVSDGIIEAIDQTALPAQERWLSLRTTAQLAGAIRKLRIRGAPMLGIAGGFGVAQAARRSRSPRAATVLKVAQAAGDVLKATRPTAVNLAWAIDRALQAGRDAAAQGADAEGVRKAFEFEAHAILESDAAACLTMAEAGQRFVGADATVLTHCNTGFLCTGGYGTALGVIRLAHERGKRIHVLAGETRPLMQGARLTAWELGKLGVPHELIPDSAGASIIARGEVDAVLVGADRIAANGDTANKIGTYPLALAAAAKGIPFVVVAPTSTIDVSTATGDDIEVEQRDALEVVHVLGKTRIAPQGTRARNPAFDVTPARYITAIVTERGIAEPPSVATIAAIAALR